MSARCEVCGKEPGFGKSVSRLGRNAQNRRVKSRTSRMWYPNIQTVRTLQNGTAKRVSACTSCIKKGKVPQRVRV